jgi:hypothetical protein
VSTAPITRSTEIEMNKGMKRGMEQAKRVEMRITQERREWRERDEVEGDERVAE